MMLHRDVTLVGKVEGRGTKFSPYNVDACQRLRLIIASLTYVYGGTRRFSRIV